MDSQSVAAIILAAGKGTRMRSSLPKVMHPIGGRPMVNHLLSTVASAGIDRVVVVVSPDMSDVTGALGKADIAVQEQALGTGHAAQCAMASLEGFDGTILILFGADPLISTTTLERLIAARRGADAPSLVVLGFRPTDPAQYGRLVVNDAGQLERIVEYWDADEATRAINLCNSGAVAADATTLATLLACLGNDNAKGEYYLTDIVGLARQDGAQCTVVEGDPDELVGIDTREDLARAEAGFQAKARRAALAGGATLIDPETVWFSFDTEIGQDVIVEPNVFLGPGVKIGDGVSIKAFSHLEGCVVRDGATVGPFARLRPGADIGAQAKIGNFVEVKKSQIHRGAKVSHLTYIGDATVGENANIGAGTITANYDGFRKAQTEIGADASIGSNVVLVAPVKVGRGATIGAGTVVRKDVADDALRVTDTRGIEATHDGWSNKKRARAEKKD
ncbi:MAG: bifunctional UDP-N-acetylglucosamine diphosphorylase/glucosamine-1-phosphate N-acetyltransferase GlmU [Alphaproteobacteria bacterium]|nr:bifunctional UDP-N-acetylglucosamine diphosphorylase/glucosamine-1-phosphate N-acetyltransferase GlmU [Alphaproteobacteria bacterium]